MYIYIYTYTDTQLRACAHMCACILLHKHWLVAKIRGKITYTDSHIASRMVQVLFLYSLILTFISRSNFWNFIIYQIINIFYNISVMTQF